MAYGYGLSMLGLRRRHIFPKDGHVGAWRGFVMSRDGTYLPEKKTNDCPVKTGLTGPMWKWKGEGEGAERRGGDVGGQVDERIG